MENIKEMIEKAWAGEIQPEAVLSQLREEYDVHNIALYISEQIVWYSVLYFNINGGVYALPGYHFDDGSLVEVENMEIFYTKEYAREYARFGHEAGEGEVVDSLILSTTQNQYDEEVPETIAYLMKHGGRYYLEVENLQCRSSTWLGMGTCQCSWHNIYSRKIVREVSPNEIKNEDGVMEVLQSA